jgi:hypothetical protein
MIASSSTNMILALGMMQRSLHEANQARRQPDALENVFLSCGPYE